MSDFPFGTSRNLLMALRWTVVLSLIAFIGGGSWSCSCSFAGARGRPVGGLYVQSSRAPLLMRLFLAISASLSASMCRRGPQRGAHARSAFLTEIWRGCVLDSQGSVGSLGQLALSFGDDAP